MHQLDKFSVVYEVFDKEKFHYVRETNLCTMNEVVVFTADIKKDCMVEAAKLNAKFQPDLLRAQAQLNRFLH